jgi:hypothetical protein
MISKIKVFHYGEHVWTVFLLFGKLPIWRRRPRGWDGGHSAAASSAADPSLPPHDPAQAEPGGYANARRQWRKLVEVSHAHQASMDAPHRQDEG